MKEKSLTILLTMLLTGCQLPNPTIYTPQPHLNTHSNINEIKQVYQYDIVTEEQQLKLHHLENEINQIKSDSSIAQDIKQQQIETLQQQYINVYQVIHQDNINKFDKLAKELENVDIERLPESVRQQYIMSSEIIVNFIQLEKFNKSLAECQTLDAINEKYQLGLSNDLMK